MGRGRLGVVITIDQTFQAVNSLLTDRRLLAQTHVETVVLDGLRPSRQNRRMKHQRWLFAVSLGVTVFAAASASAESFTLACDPREAPGAFQQYTQPIKLTIDTDRKVVELITPTGEGVWKTSAMGEIYTGKRTIKGPLSVIMSERRIVWGAQDLSNGADFSGKF